MRPDEFGGIALRRQHLFKKSLAGSTALLPVAASAMQQCPMDLDEKSSAFWALGWAIFAVFLVAGALLPWLIYRATRQARRQWRWALRIASLPSMLAMWLLGAGIFLGQFVLAC